MLRISTLIIWVRDEQAMEYMARHGRLGCARGPQQYLSRSPRAHACVSTDYKSNIMVAVLVRENHSLCATIRSSSMKLMLHVSNFGVKRHSTVSDQPEANLSVEKGATDGETKVNIMHNLPGTRQCNGKRKKTRSKPLVCVILPWYKTLKYGNKIVQNECTVWEIKMCHGVNK